MNCASPAAFAAPAGVVSRFPRPTRQCSFVVQPTVRHAASRHCRIFAVAASDSVEVRLATSAKRIILEEPLPTPGGWFVECEVRDDALAEDDPKAVTRHTVIVGKIHMSELLGLAASESSDMDSKLFAVPPPEVVVRWVFEFFLSIGKDLTRTEGMQGPETFPANYFSTRTVFNYYPAARDSFVDYVKKYNASQVASTK